MTKISSLVLVLLTFGSGGGGGGVVQNRESPDFRSSGGWQVCIRSRRINL